MFRPSTCASFISLLFFCVVAWSCTKIDNTDIGSGLLPAVDNITTFDTIFDVVANNFDSVFKNCAQIYPLDDHVLGTISNDPYFGTTTATIFTELKPATFPYRLPATFANITLDSAVLVLSYKRLYGDSTSPQKVNVYEVDTTDFRFDSSTCTPLKPGQLLLGSAIYTPQKFKDTVQGFKERWANELRIKLNNSFAIDLLSQDTNTAFKSDSLFKELFFKGFAIVPDAGFGGNALTYYNIADTNTKLAVYFKFTADSKTDTTVINFRLTRTSATANKIVRNRAGAEINNHLSHPANGDNFIYIQTTPGTYAELKIPGLTGLSNRIIHKAELITEQVYSPSPTDGYFTPPGLIYLETKYTDTTYRPIPCDFNVLSGQPNFGRFGFGGNRTASKDLSGNTISTYTFNISRYVQKIVTNKITNYTLRLSAPNLITNPRGKSFLDECGQGVPEFNYLINNITVGRVKLGGGNNPNSRMRLRIIYSNI